MKTARRRDNLASAALQRKTSGNAGHADARTGARRCMFTLSISESPS
jgi:hypothetical protein